jgi:lipoyl synthase
VSDTLVALRRPSPPPALPEPPPASAGMLQRLHHFGAAVEFYAPGLKRWQTGEWTPARPHRFIPISVTGTACALGCDHCKTSVLKGMISLAGRERERSLFEVAKGLAARGTEGILVSGGSTRSGGVPLGPHLHDLRRAREELGLRVIVHSGVVSPDLARGLAEAGVDGVMLDVIGADETIRDVYHLDLTVADFERSIALLADRGLSIIPHIVLGLHWGRLLGEHHALEMIRRHPVSTLILVVLTPLVGTPMEHIQPPPLADVVGFFRQARAAMPTTPVNLGCARPLGPLKLALDKAAIDEGLNGIAYPAEGVIDYARRSGLWPTLYETCCSLTWASP